MISLIVAHDKNRVIGLNNKLPWHLPGDLKYFKEMTMDKPIIMGRKTFESIGKPLPGRRNIVVTRNTGYRANDIETATSLEDALKIAGDVPEIMIIGGEQIFKESMAIADRLYVTEIDHEFQGDTYFPEYANWRQVSCEEAETAPDGYTFRYCIYEK